VRYIFPVSAFIGADLRWSPVAGAFVGRISAARELVRQGGVQRSEDARQPSHPCESGADFSDIAKAAKVTIARKQANFVMAELRDFEESAPRNFPPVQKIKTE
jgi:hypothetical protein